MDIWVVWSGVYGDKGPMSFHRTLEGACLAAGAPIPSTVVASFEGSGWDFPEVKFEHWNNDECDDDAREITRETLVS